MWRLTLIAFLLLPGMVRAGAWPRTVGQTFLSFSHEMTLRPGLPMAEYTSLYAEYGLTERLTLGAKVGRTGPDLLEAYAFLRRPVGSTEGANRFALELGGGQRQTSEMRELVLRPGAAWGRGFDSRFGGGWMSLESTFTYGVASGTAWGTLDATVGLDVTAQDTAILQLRGYGDRENGTVTLAPSYVRRFGSRLRAQVGALYGLDGATGRGVFASSWYEF